MAVMKVATFIRGPSESAEYGFGSTAEADLVAALLYLQKQVPKAVRLNYISQLYLPFFLVHALPGRSLVISGIGEPTVTVRHSTVPSLVQIRSQLRTIEDVNLVPNLLGELIQTFENPPKDLIIIHSAMLPTMIDTLQLLVDPSIPVPPDDALIRSHLSNKEIHDVGILFRNERVRLEACISQLEQTEALIKDFVEEQLHLLDAKKDRMEKGRLTQPNRVRFIEIF